MTDLQERICDRLIAATLSRDWVNGPLHVAALVLDPNFQLAGSDHGRRQSQLIGRMKWPRLFTLAFHGANAALAEEEDRRSLALALFHRFAPAEKQRRIPAQLNCAVATWAAVTAHPLACLVPCPLHRAMTELLRDLEAGQRLTNKRLFSCASLLGECPAHDGPEDMPVRLSSTPGHHAVAAYRHLIRGLRESESVILFVGDACREATRVVTRVRGVGGGVEMCLEVARRLGM